MPKTTSTGGNFGATLSPGSRAGGGRYVLKRLVGRGEFSELWLARDVKNVKDVALKFLPQAFLQDANLLELFQNEIGRNRLLNHPHIVPVYELTRDHDSAAIVMEYIDGWSLATMKVDKLGKSYTVDEIEPRIRELCDALSYAHKEFGLIHGGLKPSNLLLSTREGIKVSDFGLAVLIRNESSKRGIIKTGYGGIGFLSPQQVMGESLSKLDDIYSLGATIFDLLTGTPPFYKGEVIAQICSLKPPGMTQRLAELGVQSDPLPAVWEQTVAACLSKNPADRPQSVEEVRQMLGQQESSFPAVTQPAEPPPIEESSDGQEAVAPTISTQTPVEAPPLLRPLPVSPVNSTKIAVLFAGILAVFLIAVMAGGFWFIRSARFKPLGGTLDKSFNPGAGADNVIRCMTLQPDGKILIGGIFTNFNGVVCRKIARLETNGTLDVTFTPHVEGNVYAIAIQADGKILIGGQGLRPKRPARRFIRLAADGNRDAQFSGEGVYNENVRAIAIQPDGRILVGGDFTKISNKEHHGLMRLGVDDKNDDSFNINSDGSSTVISVAVQPDGKVLEAGDFNNYNGVARTHLIRLNPDGSFDTTFDAAAYADENIKNVLLQKDGKILVCGYSNDAKNVSSPYIVQLNADGSTDKSFHFSGTSGDVPWSMAFQADGKIIVGGYTDTNGQKYPYLARLNTDGSLDGSFQVNEATGGCIWSVAVQPDGRILAVGDISGFDGQPCGNIVRLLN